MQAGQLSPYTTATRGQRRAACFGRVPPPGQVLVRGAVGRGWLRRPVQHLQVFQGPAAGKQQVAVDKFDILPTHNDARDLIDTPESVRTLANYTNTVGSQSPGYPPQPVFNGALTAQPIPQATTWQSIAAGTWLLSGPSVLSLDRYLQIPSMPMDPARAEAPLKKYHYPTFTARIYITVDHTLTYRSSTLPRGPISRRLWPCSRR